jgi:pimeloyl-ACP methyl ester carboxylesterase
VWGDCDRVLSIKNAARGLRNLPNAALGVIPGTGHAPFFEKPREFLRVVLPFLRPIEHP